MSSFRIRYGGDSSNLNKKFLCKYFGHKNIEVPATFSYIVKRSPENKWKEEKTPAELNICSRCSFTVYEGHTIYANSDMEITRTDVQENSKL